MTDKIPDGLLLTPSLFQESVFDPEFELDTYGLAVAEAQLAKTIAAGFIAPEEYQRQIEEAKKQERKRILKIFGSFGKIELEKPLSGAEFEALFD